MAQCKAWGCTNNKRKNKGKHFHRVPMPSNEHRKNIALQWLHNIGTGHTIKTFPFGSNSVVCEDHFEASCYIVDSTNKVLGLPEKKRLHPNAVPTIFKHRKSKTDTSRRDRLDKRRQKKEDIDTQRAISLLTSPVVQDTNIQYEPVIQRRQKQSKTTCTIAVPSTSEAIVTPVYKDNVCHVHCQTDDVQIYAIDAQLFPIEPGTRITVSKPADQNLVDNDHNYTKSEANSQPHPEISLPLPTTSTPVKQLPATESPPQSPIPLQSPTPIGLQIQNESDSSFVDDSRDKSWQKESFIESDANSDSDHDCSSFEENDMYMSLVQQKKYVVFEQCLEELLHLTRCPKSKCNAPVNTIIKSVIGANVTYKVQYLCNDPELSWSAHPYLKSGRSKVSAGNILICAATLYSGLTYTRLSTFCDLINLSVISESTFYDVQSSLLIPVIGEAWKIERDALSKQIKESNAPVQLAGDGRCDSPGFSAKYCTYSFLEYLSGKIIDFELVQVTQTGTSQAMEKYGFCKVTDRLLQSGVPIEIIVTDRHVGIRAVMKNHYREINHQFDVYHIVNSIRKKLTDISKKKKHAVLAPWVKSILNHIWFSSKNCEGNPEKLVELFTSITYHIAGKHKWSGYKHIKQCLHPPLSSEEQKNKLWVKGSTLQAVKDIIFDKKLLKDIQQISLFCHTGSLESYHSKLLVHCPKRQEFDYGCMQARTQLAVLDHNANVGRQQAVVKQANQRSMAKGSARYKVGWKKQTSSWVARPVYETSTHDHLKHLAGRALQVKARDVDMSQFIPEKPQAKNIGKEPAPIKSVAVSKTKSRY